MVYTFAANLLEDTLSGALGRSARVVKNEKKNSLRHTQSHYFVKPSCWFRNVT